MAHKGQLNGMRGVYLVAAELCRLGFIVATTSRNARGTDILATKDEERTFMVEVKTTTGNTFWMLGERAGSNNSGNYVYVFVKLPKSDDKEIDYYPVLSKTVKEKRRRPGKGKNGGQYRDGWSIDEEKIERYKNNWSVFGVPSGSVAPR